MTEEASKKKISIDKDYLLLVEGNDDENFFQSIIKKRLNQTAVSKIQILSYDGRYKFSLMMEMLRPLINRRSAFKALGVIRDADENPSGAFQSVSGVLIKSGFIPPQTHAQFSESTPATGIFIMPDGKTKGELETLCRWSCGDDEASKCVESYIECLKDKNVLDNVKEDKTFAHAYIASSQKPEVSLGVSAQRSVWNFNAPVFDNLTKFLENLAKI